MAGGRGSSLNQFCKVPKPLIKIKGKPIIEHIVIKTNEGFSNFIVTTFYKSKK